MLDHMSGLFKLANTCGIETSYQNDSGKSVEASPEALMAILRLLDIPIHSPGQAEEMYRMKRLAAAATPLAQAEVLWLDHAEDYGEIPVALPEKKAGQGKAVLSLEKGGKIQWDVDWRSLRMTSEIRVEGGVYQTRTLEIPEKIPMGYHQLTVEGLAQDPLESMVMGAPRKAHGGVFQPADKSWGVFLPLYAARSERNLGIGDITDLQEMFEWTARHGGRVVGTLPMLAAFLDEPCEVSPYSPASKLFWNEIFLDLNKIPELEYSQAARQLLDSASFQAEAARLRALPLVDYQGVMRLKRQVLTEMARAFFQMAPEARRAAFDAFLNSRPEATDYALFRAGVEKFKTSWHCWPEPMRGGNLTLEGLDPAVVDYHRAVQWWMAEQIETLGKRARDAGARGLYLDLPLGVNSDSYDVYRHRELFALGASGGAPPDGFFTLGQDWGFPPLRPDRILKDGMKYYRSFLEHHMKSSALLRIDHVMGLHRLYWVPRGLGAKDGAYVRYPAEALYAAFNIESVCHQTSIGGEDLGTVPPAVRPAMAEHGWHRLFVGQFEINPGVPQGMHLPPEGSIAAMNTHDMPPFGCFWEGKDIRDRMGMGLISPEAALLEARNREGLWVALIEKLVKTGALSEDFLSINLAKSMPLVYRKLLQIMAQSEAGLVLVNAEDLWGEIEPQNVPGTWKEKPNWLRKARFPLVDWDSLPGMGELLLRIQRAVF